MILNKTAFSVKLDQLIEAERQWISEGVLKGFQHWHIYSAEDTKWAEAQWISALTFCNSVFFLPPRKHCDNSNIQSIICKHTNSKRLQASDESALFKKSVTKKKKNTTIVSWLEILTFSFSQRTWQLWAPVIVIQ